LDRVQHCYEEAGRKILNKKEWLAIQLPEHEEYQPVGKASELLHMQKQLNIQLERLNEFRMLLQKNCYEIISSSKRNQDQRHTEIAQKCDIQAFRISELHSNLKKAQLELSHYKKVKEIFRDVRWHNVVKLLKKMDLLDKHDNAVLNPPSWKITNKAQSVVTTQTTISSVSVNLAAENFNPLFTPASAPSQNCSDVESNENVNSNDNNDTCRIPRVELVVLVLKAFNSGNIGPKQVAYDFFHSFVSITQNHKTKC
jgi:hypothetical protein